MAQNPRTDEPLTRCRVIRGARACNLCGLPTKALHLYRECDERDRPLAGERALLFVAADHDDCMTLLNDHPRLYAEIRGSPGTFPKLCGACIHRDGFACRHPGSKANGGLGLKVGLSPGAIVCMGRRRGGCQRLVQHALDCEGQELPGESPLEAATGAGPG